MVPKWGTTQRFQLSPFSRNNVMILCSWLLYRCDFPNHCYTSRSGCTNLSYAKQRQHQTQSDDCFKGQITVWIFFLVHYKSVTWSVHIEYDWKPEVGDISAWRIVIFATFGLIWSAGGGSYSIFGTNVGWFDWMGDLSREGEGGGRNLATSLESCQYRTWKGALGWGVLCVMWTIDSRSQS